MSLLSGPGTFKHIVQIESPKLTFYLNSVIKLKITVPSSEWCGIQLCSRGGNKDTTMRSSWEQIKGHHGLPKLGNGRFNPRLKQGWTMFSLYHQTNECFFLVEFSCLRHDWAKEFLLKSGKSVGVRTEWVDRNGRGERVSRHESLWILIQGPPCLQD